MLKFRAMPKKWGNSIGIILPSEIVEEGDIKAEREIDILVIEKRIDLNKIFGSLKLKEPTQKIKDEMRAGWGK